MSSIPVILAVSDTSQQTRLAGRLGQPGTGVELVGVAATADSIAALLDQHSCATVVTDAAFGPTVLQSVGVLRRFGGSHTLVLLLSHGDQGPLEDFRRQGACLVPAGATDDQILLIISRAPEATDHASPISSKPQLIPVQTERTVQTQSALTQIAMAPVARSQALRLITCYSPKGGTGTSTVAQSVAIFLARRGISTLLIDFALYGAVAASLRLKQAGTGLSLLVSGLARGDSIRSTAAFHQLFQEALTRYAFPGGTLDVLLAAPPAKMEHLRLEDAELILATARNQYQVVIVDTSPELSERNMAALIQADRVLMTATPDVAAGWALHQVRPLLEALRIPRERVNLIINRARLDLRITLEEIVRASGFEHIASFSDLFREVQSCTNEGIPPILRLRKIDSETAGLVGALLPGMADTGRRAWWRWIG